MSNSRTRHSPRHTRRHMSMGDWGNNRTPVPRARLVSGGPPAEASATAHPGIPLSASSPCMCPQYLSNLSSVGCFCMHSRDPSSAFVTHLLLQGGRSRSGMRADIVSFVEMSRVARPRATELTWSVRYLCQARCCVRNQCLAPKAGEGHDCNEICVSRNGCT